jgi:hypothetical protein
MAIQKRARPDGAMPKGLEVEDLQIGELISEGLARSQILGSRRAFVGFERAIEGMQVGGIRRVTVPPHLAYNDGRLLICKLELLAIRQYK